MAKVLFIPFVAENLFSGGKQCTSRNLQSLERLWGEENVMVYRFIPNMEESRVVSMCRKFINIFSLHLGGYSVKQERKIYRFISENKDIDTVFLDSSLLGKLAEGIKKRKPELKVIVFFHNIEYIFFKEQYNVDKNILHSYWIPVSYLNEKKAVRYADTIIVLNNRDAEVLEHTYKRKPDVLIPISIKDNYIPGKNKLPNAVKEKKRALFVGSYFYANIQGIKWFLSNVIPYVDIHLDIVGSGMEKLKTELSPLPANVVIHGTVPDLTPFYESADFMVLPVFSGSGMKVKTAESMMYGKFLLGTDEAFVGYDVNAKMSLLCNTDTGFIEAIRHFSSTDKFNIHSRELFLNNYSFDATIHLFEKVFNKPKV